MTAADVLRGCGLFSGFTETGIQIFATAMTPRQYPSGSPIFVENMVADSLIIIGEGAVTLSVQGQAAGELGPGEWLGELALVNPGKRQCTVTTMMDVSTLELSHADFQKLAVAKPQATLKLVMSICNQFGQKVAAAGEVLRAPVSRG